MGHFKAGFSAFDPFLFWVIFSAQTRSLLRVALFLFGGQELRLHFVQPQHIIEVLSQSPIPKQYSFLTQEILIALYKVESSSEKQIEKKKHQRSGAKSCDTYLSWMPT